MSGYTPKINDIVLPIELDEDDIEERGLTPTTLLRVLENDSVPYCIPLGDIDTDEAFDARQGRWAFIADELLLVKRP